MMKALKVIVAALKVIVPSLALAVGLANALPNIIFLPSIILNIPTTYALFILFFILAVLPQLAFEVLRRLIWKMVITITSKAVFIGRNIYLLFFGNVKLHDAIDGLVSSVHSANLYSTLSNIEPEAYHHILFSHRDLDPNTPHQPVGHLKNYYIPGFPVDEAELIMKLWHFLDSSFHTRIGEIWPQCSCAFLNQGTRDYIMLQGMTVVGSPKYNHFAGELMKHLKEADSDSNIHRATQLLLQVENQVCSVFDSRRGKTVWKPDNTPDPRQDIQPVLRDYALLMKLPPIFHKAHSKMRSSPVILFAGCRAGGQVGLTQWISQPDTLRMLADSYSHQYFQIVLEVTYQYVPKKLPNVENIEVKLEERITLSTTPSKVFI